MDGDTLRLLSFFAALFVGGLAEFLWPRRRRVLSRLRRWRTNLALIVIDSMTLRFVGGVAAVSVAASDYNAFGLFSILSLPVSIAWPAAVVLLDMAIYGQHVASHLWPPLWRLHRVHHADRDVDVTTAIRFHPLEMLLSLWFKCLVILALGAPVEAVLTFEVLLNVSAMFNHANIRLPVGIDRAMRCAFVTPDMHRVHHSCRVGETNSNYGFCLSCWDRLWGTYTAQPKDGHEDMRIGLKAYQSGKEASLLWCLALPFRKK